jgi:predicted CXXCH cytochrome family protein
VSRIGLAALLWFTCVSALAQFQPSRSPATSSGERSGVRQLSVSAMPEDALGSVSNEACAGCHAAIYKSYARTPMARASGPAIQNVVPADFFHPGSGVHYRVYSEAGHVWLSFERPGDPAVRGRRELLYYIGSIRRGLSYLFAQDGFLFESPVNWYSGERRWDMAPAYQNAREIPLNLPAYTSCLRCHVSGMRAPAKGTDNLYPVPPFLHAGVTCERCHGPGTAHIATAQNGTSGSVINPAKLAPERRDAVCMQCHLEGKVAIERPGRHAYEFQPGESLSKYVRYYILAGSSEGRLGGVSQVEAMAQSVCKKKSGDGMSCTSCHDPHDQPSPEERVSYYRAKCLTCHGTDFGTRHHAAQPDCTSCHMPASTSTDVAHTQVTDHRIPRLQGISPDWLSQSTLPPQRLHLVPFPDSSEAEKDIRDLALAWESLGNNGLEAGESQAEKLLRSAASKFPDDPEVLSALGYVEQRRGATRQASELYQRALVLDPDLIDAAANLGVIEAKSGQLSQAVELWQGDFRHAPGRSDLGMNLVVTLCDEKRFDEARATALRVLEFNPDMAAAKEALRRLNRTPPDCGN